MPEAFDANSDATERSARIVEVVAGMVATVLKVEVERGQRVARGDTLVILESMKMEIPLVAPYDGIVEEIFVDEGDPTKADERVLSLRATGSDLDRQSS